MNGLRAEPIAMIYEVFPHKLSLEKNKNVHIEVIPLTSDGLHSELFIPFMLECI